MVGKYNRDTSSVTATPSTVTSSSAAFGRWAFGIGQLRRDRRGRTGIVKGRSVRSGGNVLTTLSCSASGIFAICCDLTRPTITRLARTFHSTRTRRRREPYIPLVAFCLRHFLADFIICMCEFDFRQAQPLQALREKRIEHGLERRIRHFAHPVEERRGQLTEQLGHDRPTIRCRTIVGGDDGAGALALMLRRERVHRWNSLQSDKGSELLGSAGEEIPVLLHDSPGIFEIPEDWTCIDHVDRMSLEQEACHDAEIAAAAAQAPVEVRVL